MCGFGPDALKRPSTFPVSFYNIPTVFWQVPSQVSHVTHEQLVIVTFPPSLLVPVLCSDPAWAFLRQDVRYCPVLIPPLPSVRPGVSSRALPCHHHLDNLRFPIHNNWVRQVLALLRRSTPRTITSTLLKIYIPPIPSPEEAQLDRLSSCIYLYLPPIYACKDTVPDLSYPRPPDLWFVLKLRLGPCLSTTLSPHPHLEGLVLICISRNHNDNSIRIHTWTQDHEFGLRRTRGDERNLEKLRDQREVIPSTGIIWTHHAGFSTAQFEILKEPTHLGPPTHHHNSCH